MHPVATATTGRHVWHPASNETEAAFLQRVGAEAKLPGGHVAVVFLE
jgi:hypothetical protein